MSPSTAWAATYASSVETRAEALSAVAKLDELQIPFPTKWAAASSRTFFLAGRVDVARPVLEEIARTCSYVLLATRSWARAHLYLGEIAEQHGEIPSACDHYAKVLGRWGNAEPRSVTADEARTRSRALSCPHAG